MKKFLNFEAITSWKDNIAYASSMDYNGLFEVDMNTGECAYICLFDEEVDKKRLFTTAFKVGNKIYFVPASAEKISVYEPDANHLYQIEIKFVDKKIYKHYRANEKFNGGVISGRYLYIIPCTYPGIIKVDSITDEISYFTDWVGDGDYVFRKSPYSKDGIIYIPSTIGNKILRFNLKNNLGEFINLCTSGNGWWSMCRLKNEYWLAPRNPGPIVCWNENSNCLLEFESFPDGFEGDNFYFSLCFERNDKIYFLPAKSNMGITIDSNTKTLKKWEIYTAEDVEIYQFLSIVDGYIYIRVVRTETEDVYLRFNPDNMNIEKFAFYFMLGEEKFKHDVSERLKGTVIRERSGTDLKWFVSLIG